MTPTCLATERLKKALANRPGIDRKLARHLVRYLHAYEQGRLNYPSQPENIAWMEHLFFNFAVFCPKDINDPVPDPKAEDWAEKHAWFGKDDAMTGAAYGIHARLIKEGYDTGTDTYYTELDKRLEQAFPHRFHTQPESFPAKSSGPDRP